MVKKNWTESTITEQKIDLDQLGDVSGLSDVELKTRLDEAGYEFQNKYQASKNYIHREIAGSHVLISIGENIANFNGYIQLNDSAVTLWEQLAKPSTLSEMESVLEEKYGITHEQAVEDVIGFMKVLREHDMVTMEQG